MLYIIIHHHRWGVDVFPLTSEKEPNLRSKALRMKLGINYEPKKEEYLEVTSHPEVPHIGPKTCIPDGNNLKTVLCRQKYSQERKTNNA